MASYEKNNNGWSVRFRQNIDGVMVNRRMSGFTSKKQAELAYLKEEAQYRLDEEKTRNAISHMKFKTIVDKFLDFKEHTVKPTAYSVYKNTLAQFNNLYEKRFINITKNDLQEQIFELAKDKTRKTLKLYVLVINVLFNYAADYLAIKNDANKKLIVPIYTKEKGKETNFLTLEQIETITQDISPKVIFYSLAIKTIFLSGMRIGEFCALTIKDFDFKKDIINIYKTATPAGISTPKTKTSKRKLTMPHKIMQEWELYFKSNNLIDKELYLQDIKSKTSIYTFFKQQCKKHNLDPQLTLHDLRHSHASYLLANGISIVAVSHRLGHSTPAITLSVYSHFMPAENEVVINLLSKNNL